jgi:hypothetical protein
MSKITFRADDDLIRQLEEFDASKSEVMREALREYLDEPTPSSDSQTPGSDVDAGSLDDLLADRIDALVSERLDPVRRRQPQDVNVNITLDGDFPSASDTASSGVNVNSGASHSSSNDPSHAPEERMTDERDDENASANERKTCSQCGENLSPSHVYCPNCGEKAAHRVFCDCGDELRTDWGFCPSCGRRTPAADVLDQS